MSSSTEMMKSSVILMTGLAFSFGLVLGLLVQLPGVSSPHNERLRRDIHVMRRGEETVAVSDGDQLRLLEKPQNHSGDLTRKNSINEDVHKLHSEIQNTFDDIKELKPPVEKKKQSSQDQVYVSSVVVSTRKSSNEESVIAPEREVFDDFPVIENGMFWSQELEALHPAGFKLSDVSEWRTQVTSFHVDDLQEGCGRMQNRLVIYSDGKKACARYRINSDQMQGEVYSFYLAQALNIHNVAPPVLTYADAQSPQWSSVQPQLNSAEWSSQKVVVLTPFLEQLSSVYIPQELRSSKTELQPGTTLVKGRNSSDLVELMQWSDLVIFDYLTANLDRVVNNMYNQQWNDRMMDSPAHNLLSLLTPEDTPNKLLVFLDNESGLFHGYRLLDKYASYHKQLLSSVCVFRKATVEAVRHYHESGDIVEEVMNLYKTWEPLSSGLPQIPSSTANILRSRLRDVYTQIQTCKNRYSR